MLSSIFIWARSFRLSTLVDTNLSAALHDWTLISAFVHFSGHTFTSFDIYLSVLFQFVHFSGRLLAVALHDETLISALVHFSGHRFYSIQINVPVNSYSFMRIFILLLADRLPFYCLSTLVDTPLSDALYDKPLIFTLVHFSGHSHAILDIYLSALFQFVHFSGHHSFNCITWWSAGFNACPL